MRQTSTTAVSDCAPAGADRHRWRQTTEQLDRLVELQSVLGYGQPSTQGLGTIELELVGLRGDRGRGRVEGLAPRDLLGEFREPVTVGELVTLKLRGPQVTGTVECFGFVHWQQNVMGRWLAGMFLREPLPEALLARVWMDMRRELRFPSRQSLKVAFGLRGAARPAILCDYSRSGARLQTAAVPQVGQRAELLDGEPLAIGVVRFVRPVAQSDHWEFGCEFTNNEGVRLARRAVLRRDAGSPAWQHAEDWTPQAAQ